MIDYIYAEFYKINNSNQKYFFLILFFFTIISALVPVNLGLYYTVYIASFTLYNLIDVGNIYGYSILKQYFLSKITRRNFILYLYVKSIFQYSFFIVIFLTLSYFTTGINSIDFLYWCIGICYLSIALLIVVMVESTAYSIIYYIISMYIFIPIINLYLEKIINLKYSFTYYLDPNNFEDISSLNMLMVATIILLTCFIIGRYKIRRKEV